MVEEDGFEPSKSMTTDLQSAPFSHSGIPPHLVLTVGIEPTTYWLQVSCSTSWAMPAHIIILIKWIYCYLDNKLCQTIIHLLWWRKMDSNHRSQWQQIYSLPPLATREFLHIGADSRHRTHDLLITSQLLYQLSYASVWLIFWQSIKIHK